MVDVSALKSVCFKLFRPIDWSLHGFNQKHRLSAHIKRTFPACKRACGIGKCCTDVMQIFHGFVKVFVEKRSAWQACDVREAYLKWVRHEKRKVNLVIYERKVKEVSRALRWKVSTSRVSLIEPIILFCVQTEATRSGRFLRLHRLPEKSQESICSDNRYRKVCFLLHDESLDTQPTQSIAADVLNY